MKSKSNPEYKLRKFKKQDVDSITKYANNKNIAKWLTNEFPHPYSKKDAGIFIDIVSKEDPIIVFAIEINGEAAGAIAVTPESENKNNESKEKHEKNKQHNTEIQDTKINICNKQAELGYWLGEKYWNKGIMTSVIKKMVNYGFETFDIDCIFATPFLENIVSQKVLKKVGFKNNSESKTIIKNSEAYEVFIFSIEKNQIIDI
ncbi:GNAT family N-acetyltransferase [Methanobrevibacter sp. TMH8]|uniref:GNAT family N-acetyltransferase n=1 Tax=Methanobrevibacter sp. TMH8 TaxID=2848611 RepID=UPI001CCDBEB0|nr:GNAT family protein [Methanobrevibacter sp. TMH8]MBZ9571097.1 GNAT family N-acetyltransferase [Methanobrevibacter sp. TMH8]